MKKRVSRILCSLLAMLFAMALLPNAAFAETISYTGTVGKHSEFWFYQDYDDTVESASIDNGGVPGMNLSYPNPAAVTLAGTPTQAGSYTLYVSVYTQQAGWLQYTLNVTIKEAEKPTEAPTEKPTEKPTEPKVLKITKHPTGETVEEGAAAQFVARADNAESYSWKLVSPDGATSYTCSNANGVFTGLKISGATTERLTLSNIPMSLNGWKAICVFTGAGNTLTSNPAVITVKEKPAETTEATEAETTEATTEATEAETTAPEVTTEPTVPAENDAPEKENGNTAIILVAIISAAVVAVAAIAAFVILKLRKR